MASEMSTTVRNTLNNTSSDLTQIMPIYSLPSQAQQDKQLQVQIELVSTVKSITNQLGSVHMI